MGESIIGPELSLVIAELRKMINELNDKSSKYDLLLKENKELREEIKDLNTVKQFWKDKYNGL